MRPWARLFTFDGKATVMEGHPFLRHICAHRSIRRYRDEPVPWETVETIVAAAQCSSTSSYLQTWSVVAVLDAEKRAHLAELCCGQRHVAQAPVFLVWCADRYRLDVACRMHGVRHQADMLEDFLVAAVDAAIAMQTAALAAEALGLGVCFIGGIRNRPREVVDLLGLPEYVFPISGMTLGWPAEAPPRRPRLPLPAVLHRERYTTQGLEDLLRAYDEEVKQAGVIRTRSGEIQPWTFMAARKASRTYRTDLRAAVEAQGFGLK